jgi:uncharacterized protein involved in oxidation of intracellular sulfur
MLHRRIETTISRTAEITCMARCGMHKNHPYLDGAEKSTIPALSEWVVDSDKVITF